MPKTTSQQNLTTNTHMRASYANGNLVDTARPWRFEDFWTASRCKAIKRLIHESQLCNFPKVSLYTGVPASGKSSAARIRCMISNCHSLNKVPRPEFPKHPKPCGTCGFCVDARHQNWRFAGRYHFEVCSHMNEQRFERLMHDIWSCSAWGSQTLPILVVLDEFSRLSDHLAYRLCDAIESHPQSSWVLIQCQAERQLPSPLLSRIGVGRYTFTRPTLDEAAAGILRVAEVVGLDVAPAAAQYIAEKSGADPRKCLGALDQLKSLDQVTLATAEETLKYSFADED